MSRQIIAAIQQMVAIQRTTRTAGFRTLASTVFGPLVSIVALALMFDGRQTERDPYHNSRFRTKHE